MGSKSQKSKANKKRYNDARGYGQQQQSPSTTGWRASAAPNNNSATVISPQTHEGIQSLVDHLQQQQQPASHPALLDVKSASSSATSIIIDARFVSKLTNIVQQLLDLGFSDDQLNSLAQNLASEWTLETALDWLCTNVPTLELPTLFTDGHLRNRLLAAEKGIHNTLTAGDSLTVLKFIVTADHSLSEVRQGRGENESLIHPPVPLVDDKDSNKPETTETSLSKTEQQRLDEDATDAAEIKSRILQQYAECYSDEEDEDNDERADQAYDTQGDAMTANLQLSQLSPLEQELQRKEQELQELETDLAHEANNYMRSRHETKQLQQEAKQLRRHIAGIKRKVEKERRQLQQTQQENYLPTATVSEDDEEKDYGGGDLFGGRDGGLFDHDTDEKGEDASITPSTDTQPKEQPKPLIDGVIIKGWTGTTPQKTLEEVCRKKKLGRLKYVKLPAKSGFKLILSQQQSKSNGMAKEWTAMEVDFCRGSSLQDYLALQVLYDMDATLPMYRMFPPSFRDIWLSWLDQMKEEKDKIKQEESTIQSERLDRLLAIIKKKNVEKLDTKQQISVVDRMTEKPIDDDTPAGDYLWEYVEDEVRPNPCARFAEPSSEGKNLRQEFFERQKTSDYKKMLEQRESLPMTAYRDQIIETIRDHSVVILYAETGAGKTTQCPQFLLEQALLQGRGDSVNIVCTQPRRVAATSVAERVAEEMADRLGNQVGYQIRMEAKRSKNTKLLFCTTGVLLRRLQDDCDLKSITHVIVDEVHERQVQTDVLLIALKHLLSTTRRDLKVILMSATMDSALFANFFNGAPLIQVPGRTYPVSSYHLEDLLEATGHVIEEISQCAIRGNRQNEMASVWVTTKGGEKRREVVDLDLQSSTGEVSENYPGYSMTTRFSMDRADESILNYDLIEDVLELLLLHPDRNTSLHAPDGTDTSVGSILIFLPGIGEIRSLSERLTASRGLGDTSRFTIIPLHSKLGSSDQRKAFVPSKAGVRKIILSTNIAETSVTIPDVVVVIDCGREREVRRNKKTSTSILVTDWCSKANVKQRAGRAGRVQPGLCLKLFSSKTAELMKAASEPELKRVPLEEVCLSILASGMGKSCQDFLRQAPQPPDASSVRAALDVLEEVGAINPEGDTLTPLGQHLAKLPLDVRLGKMLIFGSLFNCLDKVLTIAAALSSKSPFMTVMQDVATAKAKHKQFHDPDSDFATLCNVYEAYNNSRSSSMKAGRSFCQSNYLNQVAMFDIRVLRQDYLNLLCDIGFIPKEIQNSYNSKLWYKSPINENAHNWTIVHAVVCAGLWPNVARMEESKPGYYRLWHRNQEIFFHRSSVNASKKCFTRDQTFVCFFERFGTANRESISTTCFINSMPVLLFGGRIVVKHTERKVVIDDWMEIDMAAQVGVLLRQLRQEIHGLLQKLLDNTAVTVKTRAIMVNIADILSPSG